MLSISNPLAAGTVSKYFRTELSAASSSYYSESATHHGEFHGQIAETLGLKDQQVTSETFDRLAAGQHPLTGEQLIKHRNTVLTKEGKEVEHIAGWDLVFSAGKSISVTSLADSRIWDAHRAAVAAALKEAEQLIQVRGGGNRSAVTAGKMCAAVFHHSTSRHVDLYQAVQCHSHCIAFNLSEDKSGQARSINPHEIFVAKSFLGATYQNNLEISLRKMGYETFLGKGSTVEIAGYTKDYLESESKRTKQIEDAAKEKGLTGAKAKALLAHSTRSEKLTLTPEEIRAAHLKNAAEYGNQPQRVAQAATERKSVHVEIPSVAKTAVDFAREKLSERSAVFDHHQILYEALKHARGRVGLEAIKAEVDRQKAEGRFIEVHHIRPNAPLWRYTTPELRRDERAVIERVLSAPDRQPICLITDESIAGRYPKLNQWQRQVVRETLVSMRQTTGLNGAAGSGKSYATGIIGDYAEKEGYKVQGLAPTSGAVAALKEAGVKNSMTLQRWLAHPEKATGAPRLFFIDEASLMAARQMRKFMETVRPIDRVVLVGDFRQHGPILASKIWEEVQLAGLPTSRVNKLVRQQDEGLKKIVESFARGWTEEGVRLLDEQGRITEVGHEKKRYEAIAKAYADNPQGTLVVSPDNASRAAISQAIRKEMQARGLVEEDRFRSVILVPKQQITSIDRTVSGSYEIGDVVKYRCSSKTIGIASKEQGTVIASDRKKNTVTVKMESGVSRTYNPERLSNVTIYAPEIRSFAVGDRLQMSEPVRRLGLANRDTGTILSLDKSGNARVRMDNGHTVGLSLKQHRNVDFGYVSTSHSAQGKTVDNLILHLNVNDSRITPLVNGTLGYVALSRPRFSAHVYVDNKEGMVSALSRKEQKAMALSPAEIQAYRKSGMAA